MLARAKFNRPLRIGLLRDRLGKRKSLKWKLRRARWHIRTKGLLTELDVLEIVVLLAILSMIVLFMVLQTWLA